MYAGVPTTTFAEVSPVRFEPLRQAEVEQLQVPPAVGEPAHEQVARLQIAVHHRLRVRDRERLHRLVEHHRHLRRRQPALLGQPLAQGEALEQLHRQVRAPVGQGAAAVDVDDVRVANRADRFRLQLHSLRQLRVVGAVGHDHLQRHQPVIGHPLRPVHPAHATLGDQLGHHELAHPLAEQWVARLRLRLRAVRALALQRHQHLAAARAPVEVLQQPIPLGPFEPLFGHRGEHAVVWVGDLLAHQQRACLRSTIALAHLPHRLYQRPCRPLFRVFGAR
ncbi:MAG: hypothetical protein QM723_09205 [Myxococcaceae bacterium]